MPRTLFAPIAAVRPITQVLVWNRTPERAADLAMRLRNPDFRIDHTTELEEAARGADIVACATMSPYPLIDGTWIAPGAHVDLVGSFTPERREADDALMKKARVFVDTRERALTASGDIALAVASGALDPEDIAADLFELTRGDKSGRRHYDQITVFKSVGVALEDLAAARLILERT